MTRDEKRLIRHLVECVRAMMVHIPACKEIPGRDDAVKLLDLSGNLAGLRDDRFPEVLSESIEDLEAEYNRRMAADGEMRSATDICQSYRSPDTARILAGIRDDVRLTFGDRHA